MQAEELLGIKTWITSGIDLAVFIQYLESFNSTKIYCVRIHATGSRKGGTRV